MDRGRTVATASLSAPAIAARADQAPSAARVTVSGLCKSYGSIAAVSDVCLQVRAGEVFGLLGPNGAGKTTTLESIVGLTAADAGTIEICGINARLQPRMARQKVGVALQSTGWQDGITPREALESFAALFDSSAAVAPLLTRFGLEEKADSRVATLSGGQRQRLALALALVNDPLVMVLDEPAVGLDVQLRREFHDHIRTLRQEGRSMLLATHDMDEAAQLCDRIAVINRGRIVATGSPGDLIASLRATLQVELRADRAIDPAWLTPPTLFLAARCSGAELSFTTPDATAALARLLIVFAEHGLQVVQIKAGKGSLEDAMLELVAPSATA